MRAAPPVFDFAPGPWFSGAPEENVAETSVPTSTPSHLRLSPLWLLFAALALAIPLAPMLVSRRPAALPELGELPAFSLTEAKLKISRPWPAVCGSRGCRALSTTTAVGQGKCTSWTV